MATASQPKAKQPVPAAQTRTVPHKTRPAGGERKTATQRVFKLPSTVDRAGVTRTLLIGGVNYAPYVESISVTEQIGKDDEVKIKLNNTEFRLGDNQSLAEGSGIVVSMFDGRRWRAFPPFVVVDVERDYGMSGSISITGHTNQVTMQFREMAISWKGKKDSEVVADIAKAHGLKVDAEDTKVVHEEVHAANEPVTTVLNKLAQRNGYEWKVVGKTLSFKKVVPANAGKETGVVLRYRPNDVPQGEIISATGKKAHHSKKGKKSTPVSPATDFKKGAVDPKTADNQKQAQAGQGKAQPTSPAPQTHTPTAPKPTAGQTATNDAKKDAVVSFGGAGYQAVKPPQEVHPTEKARSVEETAKMTNAVADTNSYEHEMTLKTYDMADIRVKDVIRVAGLANRDNGRWMVTKMTSDDSASAPYRLSLTVVAYAKPGGTQEDKKAGADAKKVDPKREPNPDTTVVGFGGTGYSSGPTGKK